MGLLDRFDNDDDANETSVLMAELAARERSLNLTAEYEAPTMSEVGETTAVFPYTLYHDGETYGRDTREFVIPDNGLADTDSPLVQFVAKKHGIAPEDVTPTAVAEIEGYTADAELDADGRVVEVAAEGGEEEEA